MKEKNIPLEDIKMSVRVVSKVVGAVAKEFKPDMERYYQKKINQAYNIFNRNKF